jgi:hypothetical protein
MHQETTHQRLRSTEGHHFFDMFGCNDSVSHHILQFGSLVMRTKRGQSLEQGISGKYAHNKVLIRKYLAFVLAKGSLDLKFMYPV